MIVMSACLAGINCRYDGVNNYNKQLTQMVQNGEAILVCPEQLGGLSTPRVPAEILGNGVVDQNGKDVTAQFQKGAEEALRIAQLYGCKKAILKKNSPSCGYGTVHDGTFSGVLTVGNGVTTDLFLAAGIEVITDEDL